MGDLFEKLFIEIQKNILESSKSDMRYIKMMLQEISEKVEKRSFEDRLLSYKEAGKIMGCSSRLIESLCQRGDLTTIDLSAHDAGRGTFRVRLSEVKEWIESRAAKR